MSRMQLFTQCSDYECEVCLLPLKQGFPSHNALTLLESQLFSPPKHVIQTAADVNMFMPNLCWFLKVTLGDVGSQTPKISFLRLNHIPLKNLYVFGFSKH